MKKFASIATVMAAAILLTATVSAADIPLKRLGKTAEYNSSATVSTASLLSSRSVKNTLVVKSGEAMIIPAGKKLVLKRGCRVKGTLYIQEGGKLSVSGGTLEITGSVINDGTISVGSKASVNIKKNGELYTSASGTFKSTTKNITINDDSTTVCLGTASISGCSVGSKKALKPDLVSAVNRTTDPKTGGVIDSSKISADAAASMVNVGYFLDQTVPVKANTQNASLLFDNGSSLKFSFINGELASIGDAEMRGIMLTADITDPITAYSEKLTDMWLKKWKTISADNAMVLPRLTVYTYKMSDGSWFAALIYSSYKSNDAVFYRLADGNVTELGQSKCGLKLEMFKKNGNYILHTTNVLTSLAGADSSGVDGKIVTDTTDYYFSVNKNRMDTVGIFEETAFGDKVDGWFTQNDGKNTSIPASQYNKLQSNIISGYTLVSSENFDKNGDLNSDDYYKFTEKDVDGLRNLFRQKLTVLERVDIDFTAQ